MRFIHSADWHLGRIMHGMRLIEDQSYVLDQLIQIVRETRPDALIISGDLYDRPVPPSDAVDLLDDFLSRLVLDLGTPLLVIAGNHDSSSRLDFASRMLCGQNVHFFGSVSSEPALVRFYDSWGPVNFYATPYAEPSLVREKLGCEAVRDHETAMRALTDIVRTVRAEKERSVLIAHAFVAGGSVSESERPLSVGGAEQVDASCFHGFNYVALGHLHRPQNAGGANLSYSGSIFKYSFSEARHVKSVDVVEMDRHGACRIESIPLVPLRDVRIVEGYLRDVLSGVQPRENLQDYIMVRLLDTGAILDVMGKLRQVYPNVLHVERPCFDAPAAGLHERPDHRRLNDADLFAAFFSQVTGDELPAEMATTYESIIEDLRRREREGAST